MRTRKGFKMLTVLLLLVSLVVSSTSYLSNASYAEEHDSHEELIYSEDFEGLEVGTVPGDWVFPTDELDVTVVETADLDGRATKALQVEKATGNLAVSPAVSKGIPSTKGIVTVSAMVKPGQTNAIGGFQINDSEGSLLAQIDFRNNGKIALNASSVIDLDVSYQKGQWYELKLVLDTQANKFDIYIDDILRKADVNFRNASDHVGEINMNIYRDHQGVFTYDDIAVSSKEVAVTGVSLDVSSLELLEAQTKSLTATVEPDNATNQNVTWESSNTDVATVDDTGAVTGVSPGTATITVRTEEGSFTATCEVTVIEKIDVTGVTLSEKSISMQVDDSETLTATVEPADASIKDVSWKSSDPDVVTVSDEGKVTGIREGTATITVTTGDGAFSDTCEVTVIAKPIQATFFVSPNGNDKNPGTSANKPFKTIAKARETVRTMNSNMTGEIVVYLMEGTYTLHDTLTFDEQDSGSNGFDVIYKAYVKNKPPVISGGKTITGWSLHDQEKNIYKADVGDLLFRQLYVNGERVTRARSTDGLPDATHDDTGHTTTMTEIANWKNTEDIEFVYNQSWTLPRNLVDSIEVIDGKAHIKMQQPAWEYNRNKGSTYTRNPVWIENAYELLDEPGEWYLDRTDKVLYYIPREKDDLATANVVVPVVEKLVTVQGRSLDNLVHNIRFEGITFAYAGYVEPSQSVEEDGIGGYPDIQSNLLRLCTSEMDLAICPQVVNPGHVIVKRADGIVFERNTFTKLGQAGLDIMVGSRNIDVTGNKFYDISGSGIQVGEVDWADGSIKFDGGPNHTNRPYNTEHYNPEDKRKIIKNVRITNNYITNVGVEYFSAVGIYAGFPQNIFIAHNEVSQSNYSGISVGWGWGRQEPSVARDNKIMYNYVHDTLRTLRDGGGIYTLGIQEDSHIKGNYVKNPGNGAFGGIYLDECSQYFTVSENVVQTNGQGRSWVLLNKCGFHSAVINNYGDMDPWLNLESDYVYENNTLIKDGKWPQTALDIMDNAGIQSRYRDILLPDINVDDLRKLVERMEKEGAFANHGAAHALDVHLITVDRFAEKGSTGKVVKHMNNFLRLLDHQREKELISEEAYETLKDQAEVVLKRWK